MNTEYKELCERIKTYRIYYPLTQSELADKAGVSVRSISRFENGEDISMTNFLRILRALDLSGRIIDSIPDQTQRPSYYLEMEKKRKERKRASGTRKNNADIAFVWGDEE